MSAEAGGGPADKAREGGAPTGRTGPGVFRPKRNDERRVATRGTAGGGSPAEPPPGELGRVGFITGCLAGWIAARTPRGFHHRLLSRGPFRESPRRCAPGIETPTCARGARRRVPIGCCRFVKEGNPLLSHFPPITPAARSARRRLNADLWKALWRWMAARGRGQAHNLGLTGAAGQGDAGQGDARQGDAGEGDAGIHAPTGRAGRPRGPQGPETPTDAASPTRQPGFPPRRRSRW